MFQTLTQIATISLITIAAVFVLVGFLRFRAGRLTEHNSTSAYGTLMGFRKYYVTDQWGDNSEDYIDNKRGRVPIVQISLDGEEVDIAAIATNKVLTSADIGRQFKVRYRRFIGVTLVIDDDKNSLANYNQLQNTLFWVFMSVATIIFILGLVAYIVLPKVLGSN